PARPQPCPRRQSTERVGGLLIGLSHRLWPGQRLLPSARTTGHLETLKVGADLGPRATPSVPLRPRPARPSPGLACERRSLAEFWSETSASSRGSRNQPSRQRTLLPRGYPKCFASRGRSTEKLPLLQAGKEAWQRVPMRRRSAFGWGQSVLE